MIRTNVRATRLPLQPAHGAAQRPRRVCRRSGPRAARRRPRRGPRRASPRRRPGRGRVRAAPVAFRPPQGLPYRGSPQHHGLAAASLQALLPPPASDDTRTPAQRRADALVELARQGLEAAGGRPHVTLIVRAETLDGSTAAPGGELGRAGVIPGETARRIACDASLSIVTVD